jgi:hypothetical protein
MGPAEFQALLQGGGGWRPTSWPRGHIGGAAGILVETAAGTAVAFTCTLLTARAIGEGVISSCGSKSSGCLLLGRSPPAACQHRHSMHSWLQELHQRGQLHPMSLVGSLQAPEGVQAHQNHMTVLPTGVCVLTAPACCTGCRRRAGMTGQRWAPLHGWPGSCGWGWASAHSMHQQVIRGGWCGLTRRHMPVFVHGWWQRGCSAQSRQPLRLHVCVGG